MKIFQKRKFQKELENIMEGGVLLKDVSMAEYTSFRCGGSALRFCEPKSAEQLSALIKFLKASGEGYMILGNGTNTLFCDAGYGGTVIHLGEAFSEIIIEGECLTAGAGALLSVAAKRAAKAGLCGLEAESGIPGSVGGAVFMNAGAYEHDIKEVLTGALALDAEGNLLKLGADELELSYRHSAAEEKGWVILSADFKLKADNIDDISARMQDYAARRSAKQPLAYPSAGSFFKRPEGYFAGKLIQDSGLKGLRLGGAQVSELHSGFIINTGNATASDVINLMRVVQETVYNDSGVRLCPEVRIIDQQTAI